LWVISWKIHLIDGWVFNEPTWESLADTVIRFRPEEFDPQKIRQHALNFSEERFKQQIKDFVDQVGRGCRR